MRAEVLPLRKRYHELCEFPDSPEISTIARALELPHRAGMSQPTTMIEMAGEKRAVRPSAAVFSTR